MGLLETAFSVDALHESFMEIRKDIHFKYNVQNYRINELEEIYKFREAYKNGTFEFGDGKPFCIDERGHKRYIQPNVFRDRVVIHSFVKNILLKELRKYLIYDNCASLKGKGIDQQLDRFETHLRRYYRHYGNDGYILQTDISKYFDNLHHDVIVAFIQERISDKEDIAFLKKILSKYRFDVSCLTEEQYAGLMNGVFNLLEYAKVNYPKLGLRYLDKSVGIGNEVSQICGLFYLYKIDNYIKIVKGMKYYGRYMDDLYIISHDKDALIEILNDIKKMASDIGLEISDRKTHIYKLKRPIKYLKTKFVLTNTGKVIRIKNKETFTRERRKLKKLAVMIDNNEVNYGMVERQYKSWRGNITRKRRTPDHVKLKSRLFKNYRQLQRVDKLYNELFIETFIGGYIK